MGLVAWHLRPLDLREPQRRSQRTRRLTWIRPSTVKDGRRAMNRHWSTVTARFADPIVGACPGDPAVAMVANLDRLGVAPVGGRDALV